MKKIILLMFTLVSIFTASIVANADTNKMTITGCVVQTSIKDKTITVRNDNHQNFVIYDTPTKFLGYDKSNGKIVATVNVTNDKLIFKTVKLYDDKQENEYDNSYFFDHIPKWVFGLMFFIEAFSLIVLYSRFKVEPVPYIYYL